MTNGRDAGGRAITGAEALLAAAAQRGVTVCFANPGTTELPVVAALGSSPEIRAILGVQENVCTGAADGYARMTGRPALTLLHLGPGLANGLANLHNARRAHSPVVNVVGDHTSWHLPFDAPLTSDIAALARTVGSHHEVRDRSAVTQATRAAIDDAAGRRGVSTLVVPADFLEEPAPEVPAAAATRQLARPGADGDRIEQTTRRLRDAGSRAVLLLGGAALSRRGQRAAGDIAAATGAAVYSETFPARAERGGGLPAIDRLPYFPEAAKARLGDVAALVLAGAAEPITYFGYQGIPSRLAPDGSVHQLAGPGEDAEQALLALAENLGRPAARPRPALAAPSGTGAALTSETALTGQAAGFAVAGWLPEHAIVSIEGGTCGYPFYAASAGAMPHTVLTNTGGAIGQGLPAALGAAIACQDRPVIALQSDGSALYTAQALWTMARESANVTVLIAANNTYNVLRTELARGGDARGEGARGGDARGGDSGLTAQAARLTSLGDPPIDWVSLALGFGVDAVTVATIGDLHQAFTDSVKAGGPHLIQLALAQS